MFHVQLTIADLWFFDQLPLFIWYCIGILYFGRRSTFRILHACWPIVFQKQFNPSLNDNLSELHRPPFPAQTLFMEDQYPEWAFDQLRLQPVI